MSTVCELQGVTKRYGSRVVIDHMTLALDAGEMWALVGPSGVGKTTILNLIGLLEPPTAGIITLFGHAAPRPQSRAATVLRRRRLGYLFQNFALMDDATVEDNLDVAWSGVLPTASSRRQAKEQALTQVGLSPTALTRRIYTLSGGEQQRVAVARLALKPCQLILADEPTGSLDADNRTIILDLLDQLRAEGKTIVIVTHDTVVADRCTHVLAPF